MINQCISDKSNETVRENDCDEVGSHLLYIFVGSAGSLPPGFEYCLLATAV